MLLIGVKGHAGMSPRQNFVRGGGQAKKLKQHPHMEKKSSRKAFKRWEKAPPQKKRSEKASTMRKNVAERPLNGEKGPPKGEKRSKMAF